MFYPFAVRFDISENFRTKQGLSRSSLCLQLLRSHLATSTGDRPHSSTRTHVNSTRSTPSLCDCG